MSNLYRILVFTFTLLLGSFFIIFAQDKSSKKINLKDKTDKISVVIKKQEIKSDKYLELKLNNSSCKLLPVKILKNGQQVWFKFLKAQDSFSRNVKSNQLEILQLENSLILNSKQWNNGSDELIIECILSGKIEEKVILNINQLNNKNDNSSSLIREIEINVNKI